MDTLTENRYGTIEDFNEKNFNKRYVFVLNHNNQQPSVQGRYFPTSFSLKLEDTIFDKTTNKVRQIRVVDGEISIYKDEQTVEGQKREAVRKVFSPNGDIVIDGRETNTLEFFLKSNFNGSKPDRDATKRPLYFMLDLKQGLSHQMERDKIEAEALNWCYQAEFKHILRYGRVLGIDINRDPDEVRWTMRELAKKDAKKFLDGLKNKYTIRKFHVLEGIDKGYISVDRQANTISWKEGSVITHSPIGKDPVDHFVDLSLSTTDMDMTYTTLLEYLEPTQKEAAPVAAPVQVAHRAEENNAANIAANKVVYNFDNLIKQAVEKGVITQNKSWYFFRDKKFQGKKLSEALNANEELLAQVKRAIEEKAMV